LIKGSIRRAFFIWRIYVAIDTTTCSLAAVLPEKKVNKEKKLKRKNKKKQEN